MSCSAVLLVSAMFLMSKGVDFLVSASVPSACVKVLTFLVCGCSRCLKLLMFLVSAMLLMYEVVGVPDV